MRWPTADAWLEELERACALATAVLVADKFGLSDAAQSKLERRAKTALTWAKIINGGEGTPANPQPTAFLRSRV